MRTIAIVNQKGGCGKTTTAINLAAMLARRGLRTLLIDLDPQSHCAAGLGVPDARIEKHIGDALLHHDRAGFDPEELIWEVSSHFDLIPSTMSLAALEAPGGGLHKLPDKDCRLAGLLKLVAGHYDRCVIDCPPTIGLLTFNALRAAREALIPVETSFFALRGAEKQCQTIRRLIERIDRPIACHLLPTIHDRESRLARDILAALKRRFAGLILPVVIHEHDTIREATSFGQPIVEYAPDAEAFKDFEALVEWLEEHSPRTPVQIEVLRNAERPGPELSVSARAESTRPKPPAPRIDPSRPGMGRAAELVQRVHDIAVRYAEKKRSLDEEVRSALHQGGTEVATPPAIPRPDDPGSPLDAAPAPASPLPAAPGAEQISFAPPPQAVVPPQVPVALTSSASARGPDSSRLLPRPVHRDLKTHQSPVTDANPPPNSTGALPTSRPTLSDSSAASKPTEPIIFGVQVRSGHVRFTQPGDPGRSICVAGDFNHWSATSLPLRYDAARHAYDAEIEVKPGRHQYRLIIDGRWQSDPYNAARSVNGYGEANSVVVVPVQQVAK